MANQATRSFDLAGYVPGSPLVVTIQTFIDQGITIVYGILETYPAGWTVSDITGPGDDTGTMVNWTFLDNQNETVTYTLTPPPGTSGQAVWSGELGAMGMQGSDVVPIDCPCTLDELGAATTGPPAAESGVVRTFGVPAYTPGVAFGVTLAATVGNGGADADLYTVDEFPPFGWAPSNISHGGVFNGVSIRWVFVDNTDRVLAYDITPPLDETATRSFAGHGIFDGGLGGFNPVAITGDTSISQGAAPPVRDFTPIGSSAAAGAGENMTAEIEHYGDGSLRPPTGPDEIGAMPAVRDGAAILVSGDIEAGELLNIWNDSGVAKVRLADQSSSRPAHGWADGFASVGDAVAVRLFGSVDNRLSGMTPGAEYWLAEDGGIDTDGSAAPISQKVGVALSETELLFQPETV